MKYFIFIALASILPTSIMAAEFQDQVAGHANEKQEVRIGSKTAPQLKNFHYSFQAGSSSNGIKTEDTKYLEESDQNTSINLFKTGVEYELNKTFSTRISLGLQGQTESGLTERDSTITDAGGETFTLDERSIDYSDIEAGISLSLIHNKRLGSRWIIRNVLSLGSIRGTEEYKEYIKTDRKNPILFSNHNRYTLNSKRRYERLSVSYGIEAVFKIFVVSVEARHSEINTRSIHNSLSRSGENFSFGDDAYAFASYRDEVQDLIAWIGMRF